MKVDVVLGEYSNRLCSNSKSWSQGMLTEPINNLDDDNGDDEDNRRASWLNSDINFGDQYEYKFMTFCNNNNNNVNNNNNNNDNNNSNNNNCVKIENSALRTSGSDKNGVNNAFFNRRSVSLSSELHHVCEVCNNRQRLGRTQRHPKPLIKRRFTKAEWFSIFMLGMVDFFGFCSMSVMSPFFPQEAEKKGMDVAGTGYVFSFYALVMFIMSPIAGKMMPYVGTKFLFMSGVFLTGGSNILFGVLPQIQDNGTFALFCYLVRGVEAIGAGAFSTASFIYVIHLFPDNISAVLGILETFAGLGMSVGPALGGLLYGWGGYELPFVLLGTLMVSLLPVYYYLLPAVYGSPGVSHNGSLISLIKIPSLFVVFMVIVVGSNVWSFLDPTLEPHLRDLNLTTQQTGFVFLIFSAFYGVFCPIWGHLGDKYNNHWSMMAIGSAVSAVALLLLGPSTLLPFKLPSNSLALNIMSLCLLGVSNALTLTPSFKSLIQCAVANGHGENLTTFSMLAGIWSCAYSLGDMTGPTIGGLLLEYFDFPTCSNTMAIMSLTMSVICVVFFGLKDHKRKTKVIPTDPVLMKSKLAYYGALSNNSDAVTISITNAGACEV